MNRKFIPSRSLDLEKNYITKNRYSRPGHKIYDPLVFVIHWPYSVGWSAKRGRTYFDSLKNQQTTIINQYGEKVTNPKLRHASTQYWLGLEGEWIALMPENELAYAVGNAKGYTNFAKELFGEKLTSNTFKGTPNWASVSVEVSHTDIKGNMTNETIDSLIDFSVDFCWRHQLESDRVVRHYDITGKRCPRLYVENEGLWKEFKQQIQFNLDKVYKEREQLIKDFKKI